DARPPLGTHHGRSAPPPRMAPLLFLLRIVPVNVLDEIVNVAHVHRTLPARHPSTSRRRRGSTAGGGGGGSGRAGSTRCRRRRASSPAHASRPGRGPIGA